MKDVETTIPVFVDDVKYDRKLNMTRLSYLYLECPERNTFDHFKNNKYPKLIIIDLEAIVVSGLGGNTLLDHPKKIDELFNFIEHNTPYVVNTSYFWLPNSIINRYINTKLTRKNMLRVHLDLFLQATQQLIKPQDIQIDSFSDDFQAIVLSPKEADAFNLWTNQTVDRIRNRYHEKKENSLRNRK